MAAVNYQLPHPWHPCSTHGHNMVLRMYVCIRNIERWLAVACFVSVVGTFLSLPSALKCTLTSHTLTFWGQMSSSDLCYHDLSLLCGLSYQRVSKIVPEPYTEQIWPGVLTHLILLVKKIFSVVNLKNFYLMMFYCISTTSCCISTFDSLSSPYSIFDFFFWYVFQGFYCRVLVFSLLNYIKLIPFFVSSHFKFWKFGLNRMNCNCNDCHLSVSNFNWLTSDAM